MLSYGVKIEKIAHGLCFACDTKLPDQENSRKYLPFGEKIVKIGPVDTEIALLIVKNKKEEEITEGKYIARSASLPNGLKRYSCKT